MKRVGAVIFALFLMFALVGCQGVGAPERAKPSVVCTIFPSYDWVRQILGDRAEEMDVRVLLTGRADLHSYQPTVQDIADISTCDLFIYVGGESDAWVQDVLAEATNADMRVISLLEAAGDAAKQEELLEGMEEESGEEEEGALDEHIWLSLRNAQVLCAAIAEELCALDEANAGTYRANLAAYTEELGALDARYAEAAREAQGKPLLFGDRFPFRYMMDDYAIECFAAFPGCSAETEASFETIAFLANKVDEEDLLYVLVTESSDQSVAETIIQSTRDKDQHILMLDSMQSVSQQGIDSGATYLAIMVGNLDDLKAAFYR